MNNQLFTRTTILFGIIAISHALLTWPLTAVFVFFGSGTLLAFGAEQYAISKGWLAHRIGHKLAGVPIYALFGWVTVIYVAFRLSILFTPMWGAVPLAAVLATTYDVMADYRGVQAGYWAYTNDLPGPRFRGVPWWNYAGWIVISAITTAMTIPFL